MRRTVDVLAVVATCAVVAVIVVNAVFLQAAPSLSRKLGTAAGNTRDIREFLRGERREIQSAIGRVKTMLAR